MNTYLLAAQIGVAVLLTIAILLQQRGTALGSAFGGEGTSYATRRGIQKYLFWFTVVLGIFFISLSLLPFLL